MPRHKLPPKQSIPPPLLRAAALELLVQDFFTLLKISEDSKDLLFRGGL